MLAASFVVGIKGFVSKQTLQYFGENDPSLD